MHRPIGILNASVIMALTLTAHSETPRHPVDKGENGFIMLDVLNPLPYNTKAKKPKIITPIILDEERQKIDQLISDGRGLKQYRPNFSFLKKKPLDLSDRPSDQAPWLQNNLDVRREIDAKIISHRLLLYILEGWFDDVNLEDHDSQFRVNRQRLWCNTPWLNVTEKGREALHGLTKEFPIRRTTVYPDVPEDVDQGNLAVTWGSSFFNYKVCQAYNQLFKEPVMISQIRHRRPQYRTPEGGVAFKLLFSTMLKWSERMPVWGGAYDWYAHLSPTKYDKNQKTGGDRLVMNVPLVQIDISLRDPRLRGTKDDLKNWVMTSYYYDVSYTNPDLENARVPEPFKHMRPYGLQFGLDLGESHIFVGANNNHRPDSNNMTELPYDNINPSWDIPNRGDKTRLNGPVDNTVSSCLGCHAQSGLNMGLKLGEEIPTRGMGFMTNADYLMWSGRVNGGTGYDFNMQLEKAMRNFATSKDAKINGPEPEK